VSDKPQVVFPTLAAALILCCVLLGQLGCWIEVVRRDHTPLVADSGEMFRQAVLLHSGDLPEDSHRPPLLWATLAGVFRLTGPTRGGAAGMALVCYFGLVGMAWALGARLSGRPEAGFLAAVCCASLPGMIGPARYLIPDQPTALLICAIWLALLACDAARHFLWTALGGLLAGLAILCKLSSVHYLLPLLPWVIWQATRSRQQALNLLFAFGVTLLLVIPWWMRSGAKAIAYYGSSQEATSSGAWGMSRSGADFLLYYPEALWSQLTGPLLGCLLLGGLLFAARCKTARGWLLYLLGVLLVLTATPTRVPRYAYALLPLVCALASLGLLRIVARPRRILAVGCALGAMGLGWSASLLISPTFGSHYPPVARYQTPGSLIAEDLAGVGLFVPGEWSWRGREIAQEIRQHGSSDAPLVIIGTRLFVCWDVRHALLEAGYNPAWLVAREMRDVPLSQLFAQADFVLYSDYSAHERDLLRGNLARYSEAELARRGHAHEAAARHWFDAHRERYRLLSGWITPDGKRVTLHVRREIKPAPR